MDEMRVEIDSADEEEEEVKTENPTEAKKPDADTTQELTAEVIANLNEDSYSSDSDSSTGRIPPIHIEFENGTDKWHMEDKPAVHMYSGTDITKAEAMSKSAEDLARGIYRSANTLAPVTIEDANSRGHRMPSRIDQNRPWTKWNISPRQSDYTFFMSANTEDHTR